MIIIDFFGKTRENNDVISWGVGYRALILYQPVDNVQERAHPFQIISCLTYNFFILIRISQDNCIAADTAPAA